MPDLIYQRDVTVQFSDLDNRVALPGLHVRRPRSPGLHISGILHAIALRVGWLKPGEPLEEDYPWHMALGSMWEEYWFSLPWAREAGTVWQPGEQTYSGISGNADGITPWDDEADGPVLEETKFTSLKVRDWEELRADKKMWEHQVRAYLGLYGLTELERRGEPACSRQTVMYYRGDYRGSGPICRQYLVRWSNQEIRDTWAMLANHRHLAAAEG
jgi:hypothetical protein